MRSFEVLVVRTLATKCEEATPLVVRKCNPLTVRGVSRSRLDDVKGELSLLEFEPVELNDTTRENC
jgi:hypothetical protein